MEAERALLGCMMQSPDAIEAVAGLLTGAAFYLPDHGRLFDLLVGMHGNGERVDTITVADRIMVGGKPDAFGGLAYVANLPDAAPSWANAGHYAKIVRRTYLQRDLSRALAEEREALTVCATVEEAAAVVERLTARIGAAMGDAPSSLVMTEEEAWTLARDRIAADEEARATRGAMTWGLGIDAILNPPAPGQLVVIGARPAMGKTALGLHVHRQAITAGVGSLLVSLEVSSADLVRRHAASMGVDYTSLTRGSLGVVGWERYDRASRRTFNRPGFYLRRGQASVGQIVASVREAHRECRKRHDVPLRVVTVDYVGLVQHERIRGQSEADAIGNTSRALKLLALDLDLTVVAMSQLNREVEKRTERRPTLADLRSSGSLEQDADVVALLWSEDAQPPPPGEAARRTLTVAKQRTGGLGDVPLRFIGQSQRFEEPSSVGWEP